ncbi:MAG: hypothetical protein WD342_01590 [Verrucomicrobiales bacterium]
MKKEIPSIKRMRFWQSKVSLSITACFTLAHAVSFGEGASISEFEDLFKATAKKWMSTQTIEFDVAFKTEWTPAFLKHREDIGYPLQIKDTKSVGTATYFAKGENYGYNLNQNWSNGAIMRDEAGAWDGNLWQRLNRYPSSGAELEVSKVRIGDYESSAKYGSPFEYAFPFLREFPRQGDVSIDGWKYNLSLERVASQEQWFTAIAHAARTVGQETLDGKAILVLTFDRGFLGGDRSRKARYKVWFDKNFPEFPVQVQTLDRDAGLVVSEYRVTEFSDSNGYRFPKKYSYSRYDGNKGSAYGNRPYQRMDFTVTEAKFNKEIEPHKFSFDASSVGKVVDLSTGRTIRVE